MKVLVLSMQTWGEMGNWLSGKSLADGLLRERPAWQATQLAVDRIVPRLAETGAEIRSLTKGQSVPSLRFRAYTQLMERLSCQYPVGFEQGVGTSRQLIEEIGKLRDTIALHDPDVVVGTKGIVCRLALAAVRPGLPVVNYVTNHAHFRFAVHSCPTAARHLVRLSVGRDYLEARCGYAPKSIVEVGYLVNAWVPPDAPRANITAASQKEPHFVVTSNRGGAEYLEVLSHLVRHPARPSGVFVGLNDPELCDAANNIVAPVRGRWDVVEKLDQERLMAMMADRHNVGPTALVSKASPNSIMEAVYMQIPLFLFRSGLPMEDWSCDLVTDHGFGMVAEDAAGVCAGVDWALEADAVMDRFRQNERSYASESLNQADVRHRIATAVEAAVSGEGIVQEACQEYLGDSKLPPTGSR